MNPIESPSRDELATIENARSATGMVTIMWFIAILAVFAFGLWLVACLESAG